MEINSRLFSSFSLFRPFLDKGVPGCGGLLTDYQGQFSSPAHPDTYSHNLDCEWEIRASAATDRVRINFLSFDVEEHGSCR